MIPRTFQGQEWRPERGRTGTRVQRLFREVRAFEVPGCRRMTGSPLHWPDRTGISAIEELPPHPLDHRSKSTPLPQQPIVVGMGADPEPDDHIAVAHAEGTAGETDPRTETPRSRDRGSRRSGLRGGAAPSASPCRAASSSPGPDRGAPSPRSVRRPADRWTCGVARASRRAPPSESADARARAGRPSGTARSRGRARLPRAGCPTPRRPLLPGAPDQVHEGGIRRGETVLALFVGEQAQHRDRTTTAREHDGTPLRPAGVGREGRHRLRQLDSGRDGSTEYTRRCPTRSTQGARRFGLIGLRFRVGREGS
jgi:hypothetical protein